LSESVGGLVALLTAVAWLVLRRPEQGMHWQ